MNVANLLRFRTQGISAARDLWPALVTIAGRSYNGAAQLGPVTLELPGGGAVERRALTVIVSKDDLPVEPAHGTIVVHDRLSYTVNSTTGRGPTEPAWKLMCIEKERQ